MTGHIDPSGFKARRALELRERLNLSSAQIAERLGVPVNRISDMIRKAKLMRQREAAQ